MKSYLGALIATFGVLFLAAWGIVHVEFSKIEPLDYQFTRVHAEYLAKCDVGDIVILGDSTADADFIPSRIGPNVVTYALAGATPVENYFIARSLLDCPVRPKAVILSFVAASFRPLPTFPQPPGTYFWARGVEQGVVTFSDAMQVLKYARMTNDRSIAGPPSAFEGDYKLRAFLTGIAFPPFLYPELSAYLWSEIRSFRRPRQDMVADAYAETRLDMGHHFFGTSATGAGGADFDALRSQDQASPLSRFQISPLTDVYFRQTLKMFRDEGVKVYIVEPPRNQSAYADYSAELVPNYQRYLLVLVKGEPGATLLDPGFHVWDTTLFGDLSHLNVRGADAYSDEIRQAIIATGGGDLVFSDKDVSPRNLYGTSSASHVFELVSEDGNSAVSAAQISPPALRYASASPVWLDHVLAWDVSTARATVMAPSLSLGAGTHYVASVFIKDVDAGHASLQLSWPEGAKASVGWDFSRRQTTYSGMANNFNSGVTLCPGGWVQLYLTAVTGQNAGPYPGPIIALPADRGAAADIYDVSMEKGLWPANYCPLQPGEAKVMLPATQTTTTMN